MRIQTYKSAVLYYTLLFFCLCWPFWLRGEVISPFGQYAQLGVVRPSFAGPVEYPKFGDFILSYIPEITQHLHGKRSGWLALWTEQNELGRPLYQISGFSAAYLPSWLLSLLTDSPWRFITSLSLVTCFTAGLFILLLSRELRLAPIAGLVAGISLAASPLFLYWLSFPMFPAVWCWSAGACWAVTRLARRIDIWGWTGLAFSIYSLLMTAYPQPVVFNSYILGGYGVYLTYSKMRHRGAGWLAFAAVSVSSVAFGVLAALPAYLDLILLRAESARTLSNASFFTAALPKVSNFDEAFRLFVASTTPELLGNPIGPYFPLPYDGLSVTLVGVFFAVVAALSSFRQTYGWWLAVAVFALIAFIHPLYTVGVDYLGFNLSRSNPLGSIALPLTLIIAFGVDALARKNLYAHETYAAISATVICIVLILLGLCYGLTQGLMIDWLAFSLLVATVVCLAAQTPRVRPVFMLIALALGIGTSSYPLILHRSERAIVKVSAFSEEVRSHVPNGSRFAVVGPELAVLPPNQNASVGIASIHSYNSLSPTRYHHLIASLGGSMSTYGRWNSFITPDLDGVMFWMSNISLVLSTDLLSSARLRLVKTSSGVNFYEVAARMGEAGQFVLDVEPTALTVTIANPRTLAMLKPHKHLDDGDVVEFDLVSSQPSLFVRSQKFHRDWAAQILGPGGWRPARTVEVNGVFEGVVIPANATRIRLEFRPYVRYSWIANTLWLCILLLGFLRLWHQRRRSHGDGFNS